MNFAQQRREIVANYREAGKVVPFPDTEWGTGPANFPAVNGIAHVYMWTRNNLKPEELGGPPDRDYMATKFQSELCERVYDLIAGDYQWDCGSVDELGFFGGIELDIDDYFRLGIIHFWDEVNGKLPLAVGIEGDDRGFIYVMFFHDLAEYESFKSEIEAGYSNYWKDEEMEANGNCDECGGPIDYDDPSEPRKCVNNPSHDPYSDGHDNGGDPLPFISGGE